MGDIDRDAEMPISLAAAQVNTDLSRNVVQTGWLWWVVLGFFASVLGWGALVFAYQVYDGMGAYGNNRPVYWALPIINFVFWAGVALSGTMISAILRLLHAGMAPLSDAHDGDSHRMRFSSRGRLSTPAHWAQLDILLDAALPE